MCIQSQTPIIVCYYSLISLSSFNIFLFGKILYFYHIVREHDTLIIIIKLMARANKPYEVQTLNKNYYCSRKKEKLIQIIAIVELNYFVYMVMVHDLTILFSLKILLHGVIKT
jgi:hypothetical protein